MKQRIITGVVAGGVFLAVTILGGYGYVGLLLLMALIGMDEFVRMQGNVPHSFLLKLIGMLGVLGLAVPWTWLGVEAFPAAGTVMWLALFVLLAVTVLTKNKVTIDHVGYLFAGILYLGFGFRYMIETRLLEPDGLVWTLLVFACIWLTDAGAYFTGYFAGKHLLWPEISPKKTIEGAIGGILLSILAAVVCSLIRPDVIGLGQAVGLGLAISLVGQLGDLMQSAYKRIKGVKDTGTLLPGHGGVLDRVDSWLIVFPFVHIVSFIP